MSANIIPTENDILMGRGARTREHTGNKNFQSIVRQYRESYAATRTYKEKDAVANEVLAAIREQDPPGRFLTDNSSSKVTQSGDSTEGVVWSEVVDNKKIMEKIKQALREPDNKSAIRRAAILEEAKRAELVAAAGMGLSNPPPVLSASALFLNGQLPFYNVTDPDTALHGLPGQQNLVSDSLFLPPFLPDDNYYGVASLSGLAQFDGPEARNGSVQDERAEVNETKTRDMSAYTDSIPEQTNDNRKGQSRERDSLRSTHTSSDIALTAPALTGTDLDTAEGVADVQLLYSSMYEEVRRARAQLEQDNDKVTEEEKEQALADLFGSLCEIDQSKKRLKPVPETEISVLLKEMQRVLDAIPSHEKQALLEAHGTALPIEFSDGRMELFLRVEDMNPERAARRFVTYWKERRNLFGPDKFCLPMTLNGALRDDYVCLESGPLYLAPALDASGRMVSGFFINRMKSDIYDSQNILRCWWFYLEVASKHPNAKKGLARVAIDHCANTSLFDIDWGLVGRVSALKEKAVPIKDRVTHLCNLPCIVSAIAKPIALAKVTKDSRLRKVFHDCREEETAAALQDYGIPAHILPKEMGGQCDFEAERKKWLMQLKNWIHPKRWSRTNLFGGSYNFSCISY